MTEPGKELVDDNTPDAKELSAAYDIARVELAYEEFLMRYARKEEDEQWIEEFRAQLDRISGGAEHFTLNGREVLTYRRNGNLNARKLEAEHPDIVARYTRLVTEMKLDREALEREEPEIYKAFRAKVFRVSPRARSSR